MSFIIITDGFGVDPDVRIWARQLSSKPSSSFLKKTSAFIKELKSKNIWDNLDRLWVFATEAQSHARVSLKNPTSTQITEVNSPTWTRLQGYTGDGSSTYLNLNYNASTNGVKFTLNSGSGFHYSRTNWQPSGSSSDWGGTDSTRFIVYTARTSVDTATGIINSNGGPSNANTNSQGFYHIDRSASNLTTHYKNGTSLGTNATASTAIPSVNLFCLARNGNGTPTFHVARQFSIMGFGASVNATDLNTAVSNYATAIGFNV